MIVGVVQEPDIPSIARRLATLGPEFDCVELRLDACRHLDMEALAGVTRAGLPVPAIVTLRPKNQGGHFEGSEEERLALMRQLASLQPAWLDVEHTVAVADIAALQAISPKTRLILSYHDFKGTPPSFARRLWAMRTKAPGAIHKMAFMARKLSDALRLLLFCRDHSENIIGISMGEAGACTRILAPLFTAGFTYCPVTTPSAPGQLAAQDLCSLYNYKKLNKNTRLYGLLGSPVTGSKGHNFHNRQNAITGENAVYVKWDVPPAELGEVMPLLRKIGLAGASVTMPLKEHILPFAEVASAEVQAIGAANTLVLRNGKMWAHNTDAPGAVESLPFPVRGKTVAVLGAGGAGRAIMYEVLRRGGKVLSLNRTPGRTGTLPVQALPLDALKTLARENYDCLVNTLPATVPLAVGPKTFLPGAVVMDITYTAVSPLLSAAAKAGCQCIDGKAMFVEQALMQRRLWGLACTARE